MELQFYSLAKVIVLFQNCNHFFTNVLVTV